MLPSRCRRPSVAALLLFPLVLAGCTERDRQLDIVSVSDLAAAALADSIEQTVSVDIADGLELSLWASENLVADPIALAFDDRGVAWYTRTIRQKNSEFDIRWYPDWVRASSTWKTVEDRRAFLRETFSTENTEANSWLADLNGDSLHDWRDLAVEKERAYFVEDTSGDGRADRAQLYIEDFNEEITDIAGALLPVGDDVYMGVAPDVWRLTDRSGDGVADEQTSISHGYAVHIGFSGHNVSGLTRGPDGRLYWSIGDIGFDVTGPDGKRWAYPNQGAILRSELDGSGFEVFAAGLRNTHEFVFDKYGNLISVDNDGDHNAAGEQERIVYVVNGSDSGWRSNWQYGKYSDPDNNGYKVWIDEGLWRPRFDKQAAYLLPPVASYHAGPAGMAYNPGTALSPPWQDHFFVAEFVGAPARSRIFAFRLEPDGAGFEFAGEEVVARGILATGIDFGPDGALYVADWIEGWNTNDQGRIWKLDTPEETGSDVRREVQSLLSEDPANMRGGDLVALLGHADMRVRMKAQFELADRGDSESFLSAMTGSSGELARLHAIWGIGQLARESGSAAEPLLALLSDSDPEARAQAARVLGDVRYTPAADALVSLVRDPAPRVRYFATEALGRLAHRPGMEAILEMLEANDDRDTYLRHGGAIALARIGDVDALAALADHESRALRLAAIVALRRMGDPVVGRFMTDADEYVVTEAARAINDDESIERALPALADALATWPTANEALVRRALNANLRLGTEERAAAVARFALIAEISEPMRAEAVAVLGVWAAPSILDRVDGVYRGEVTRDASIARAALEPIADALLGDAGLQVRVATAGAIARLSLESALPALDRVLESDPSPQVRTAALEALADADYSLMESAIQTALLDRDEMVRMTALERIESLSLSDERTVELLSGVVEAGALLEQQTALATLGRLNTEPARRFLADMLDHLEGGSLSPALRLDVSEAVAAGGTPESQERLEALLAERGSGTPPRNREELLAAFGDLLEGGNSANGRVVAFQNAAGQCTRCHAFANSGDGVGPSLGGIAGRLTRVGILESLVAPSAQIAAGYGAVTLTLNDGSTIQGLLRGENDGTVQVQMADGSLRSVRVAEIAERQNAPSAMPAMGQILDRRELRDLVAFLASLDGS